MVRRLACGSRSLTWGWLSSGIQRGVVSWILTDVSGVLATVITRDSKHIWNVGQILRNYTAQHPREHLNTRHSENLISHRNVNIVIFYIKVELLYKINKFMSERHKHVPLVYSIRKANTSMPVASKTQHIRFKGWSVNDVRKSVTFWVPIFTKTMHYRCVLSSWKTSQPEEASGYRFSRTVLLFLVKCRWQMSWTCGHDFIARSVWHFICYYLAFSLVSTPRCYPHAA
jgi:hypothetical protein